MKMNEKNKIVENTITDGEQLLYDIVIDTVEGDF